SMMMKRKRRLLHLDGRSSSSPVKAESWVSSRNLQPCRRFHLRTSRMVVVWEPALLLLDLRLQPCLHSSPQQCRRCKVRHLLLRRFLLQHYG
ncbi:hypothetical protein FRC16_007756, partial [Serendipita sp. 398]